MYAKLIVDAFRIRSRTSRFLRNRMLVDGHTQYVDPKNKNKGGKMPVSTRQSNVQDFKSAELQPYE